MRIKVRIAGDDGFQQFYNRVCEGMASLGQMSFSHFTLEYDQGVLRALSEDGETVLSSMMIVDQVLGSVGELLREEGIPVELDVDCGLLSVSRGWVEWETVAEILHCDGKVTLRRMMRRTGIARWVKGAYAQTVDEVIDLAEPGSVERLVERMRVLCLR